MDTAIVLFTRDLRVDDNPALTVPPNRARFLADSLAVLQQELRERGGDLVIRAGDPVAEVIRPATNTAWAAMSPGTRRGASNAWRASRA